MRNLAFKITCAVLALLTVAGFLLAFSRRQETIKKDAAALMSSGFECNASVIWDGKQYGINITRPAAGQCTVTFTKPYELSGLGFILDGDGLKVKYGGIEAAIDPSSLPQSALFNALLGAFDAAVRPNEVNAASKDGKIVISGNTNAGGFSLTLNKQNKPELLEIPSLKLKVNIENFKWI